MEIAGVIREIEHQYRVYLSGGTWMNAVLTLPRACGASVCGACVSRFWRSRRCLTQRLTSRARPRLIGRSFGAVVRRPGREAWYRRLRSCAGSHSPPRGHGSAVGEDASVSGGPAQRVSIARVLLADPPTLILNTATVLAGPEPTDPAICFNAVPSQQSSHQCVVQVARRLSFGSVVPKV